MGEGGVCRGDSVGSEVCGSGDPGREAMAQRCPRPAGTLPLTAQESAVVEDLLYVLVGVDGRYITAQPLTGRQSRTDRKSVV